MSLIKVCCPSTMTVPGLLSRAWGEDEEPLAVSLRWVPEQGPKEAAKKTHAFWMIVDQNASFQSFGDNKSV